MKILIAVWNGLPTSSRIYFAVGVLLVFIIALLLGYGPQAFDFLVG